MLPYLIYVDIVVMFIATVLSSLALRNVHRIEYNLEKNEKMYIFRDDKFLTRTLLRGKVWCLFGGDISLLLFLGARAITQMPFPTLFLKTILFLACLFFLLLSLIFHLIYAKKELNFLRITKVTDEGLLA